MAGKTNTHADAVLNILRGTAVPAQTPYVGLFSTAPSDDSGSGAVEISAGGYSRQSVSFSAPTAGTGTYRKISNSSTITFGQATANWPQAVAFGIWNASTAGTLLYWANLSTPKTVYNGDYAQFAAGALVVNED